MTTTEKQAIGAHIAAHADEALQAAGELAEIPEAHEAIKALCKALGSFDNDPIDGVLFGAAFALGASYASKRHAAVMRRIMAGVA